MTPLIYGGAQERPGLEFIASQKTSSAKGRVVAFEHSVDDTYVLLFENQVIRLFKDGTQVLDGVGTEDISGLDNVVAHWLLNEITETTVVDDDGATHNGTASVDISTLTKTGKVGSGCFDLDGQYDVEITDHDDFSFTDNSDDSAFSIACWGFITKQGDTQVLLSKWRNSSTTQEWRFNLTNERKLQLHLVDSSSNLESARIAQWKLNEDAATKTVLDTDATSHDGLTQTSNTEDLTETGKIGKSLNFGKVGTDAVVITNDSAEFSFIEGVNGDFSIAAWVYVTATAAEQNILTKYQSDTAREWRMRITADEKLDFVIADETNNVGASATSQVALTEGWHFVVGTYEGENAAWTGPTAGNYITLYVDNIAVAVDVINNASYVKMVDQTTKVVIGAVYNK